MFDQPLKADFHVKLPSDGEPQVEDPGRSLIEEVSRLKTAIQLMVELQGELLKKLSQQDVKLTALAKFVSDQSNERATFEVL
jgi:hypothetical protein